MNAWLGAYLNCPEVFLTFGMVVILLVDLVLPEGRRMLTFYLSEFLLIFLGILFIKEWPFSMQVLFSGHYLFDTFAAGFKALLVLLTFLVFAYAKYEAAFQEHLSEFYLLGLLSLLGAMVLVSAGSLITLYLGLELLSLPLYALVALKRDSGHATEAAMKYFVMGALASALLLFSFSLFYGMTGSIYLADIVTHMNVTMALNPVFYLALSLVVIAVAFKLGVFPFHMWVPDVYQGAPLSVVSLLASIAKLAGFALLIRVLLNGLGPVHTVATQLLFILGIFSLLVGNTVALLQKNIKRLLAYSTVANMGIVFMALGLATPTGFASSAFYLITYAFMSVAMLGLLMLIMPRIESIDELKGLHQTHPGVALLLLLVLLSFAGIPPLLGFDAKLMVILALLNQQHLTLSFLVILMSVVAAAYYLMIVKTIYFEKSNAPICFKASGFSLTLASVNTLALVGFGIFPAGFMLLTHRLFF